MAEQPVQAGTGAGAFPATARGILTLADGDVVVENEDGGGELLRVRAGGTVTWDCPANSPLKWWAIVLKEDTPFDDGAGSAGNNRGNAQSKRIRGDANGTSTRRYAYAIVASDGKTVYFRDPEIEVGSRDGGG
jgi:hypothetical protein